MEVTLSVPDITCGHCARTITRAVEPLDGIGSVEVDINARTVTLNYDRPGDLGAALSALASKGYPPMDAVSGEQQQPIARRGTAIDPVCGMTVRIEDALYHSNLKGIDYYFCSSGCQQGFESEKPVEAEERAVACACCSPA